MASLTASSLHQDSGTIALSGADWAVSNASWTLTRKATGGSTIALTNIGTTTQHTVPGVGNFTLTYTDGPSGAGSANGIVYVTATTFSTGSGVQVTLPADTNTRVATVYWGTSGTTGRVTASLSDGSAANATHQVPAATDAQNFGFITTVQYQAGSASQTLTIKLTTDVALDGQEQIAFQGVVYNTLISGSAASTQAANTSSASGSVTVSGSSASTQQQNTAAASGAVSISGSASSTQNANTSSGSGQTLVSGSSSSAQQKNASAASGSVLISGAAASTQSPNISNASGTVGNGISGSGASVQAPNVSAASGSVVVSGVSASTQGKNITAASGSTIVSGSAASVQAANVSLAVGVVSIIGSANSTQALNVSSGSGKVVGASYPVDPNYLVSVTQRSFCVSTSARPFCCSTAARYFYVLCA